MSSRCYKFIPFGSLFALIISLVGCISFIIIFDGAVEGFSQQVNTLMPVGSFTFRWLLLLLTIFFITMVIGFLAIGIAATSASAELNSNSDTFEESSSFSEQVTSPIILGSFTLGSLIFVCFWSLIVCVSAIFAVLYFIFIGSVYSFCALVDNQCFDFTVLLPAVVSRLTNKKVDLTFCKDKKEALCAAKYNQTWSFIGSFLCALLALLGLIYFLMCMTANYVRLKSERRARKGDHYAMNQGTVDSNSFIMTNMGK